MIFSFKSTRIFSPVKNPLFEFRGFGYLRNARKKETTACGYIGIHMYSNYSADIALYIYCLGVLALG